MTEVDYNNLLLQYRGGNLIPILGSDLFKIRTQQDVLLSLEEYIMKSLGKVSTDEREPEDNFSEFTFRHPDLDNQVPAIYDRLKQEQIESDMITQLANLQGFKVFITTSADRTLEDELGIDTEVYVWNHTVNLPIQLNFTNQKKKLIYLFGRIKKLDEPNTSISFSDVDRIECLYNLSLTNTKSSSRDNYSLLEYLKGKTLLFIGNNFQDWFMRFAIRILCNAPYNNIIRRVYIITDVKRKLNFEEFFFRRFEIQLIYEHPIQTFVNNLCNAIHEDEQVTDRFENKQVFISYDRDDSTYAHQFYDQLRNNGINTWIDKNNIKPGEHKEEITRLLQTTTVFISLLSKTLVHKPENDSYVKNHEWKIVEDRYRANNYLKSKGDTIESFTILPVAVDDFSGYVEQLPTFLRNNTIYPIDRPDLIQYIDQLLQD